MSSANGRAEVVGRPWRCRRTSRRRSCPRNRRMYGSASTRTAALRRRVDVASGASRRPHVLVDVGVGEVVGEDRGPRRRRGRGRRSISRWRPAMCAAHARSASWSTATPPAAHGDAAVGDRHQVGVEVDAGAAELAGDAAPVGVLAVPRALAQLALGRPCGRPGRRLVVGCGARDAARARPWWRPRRRRPSGGPGRRRPRPRRRPGRRRSTGPAGPLASSITVSLVDVQPSTVSALNESATPARSAACSAPGSAAASVVSTASIVAMFGASIAAPLAMPPTVKPSPSTTTSLRWVSVVQDRLGRVGAAVGGRARRPAPGSPRLDRRRSAAGCR